MGKVYGKGVWERCMGKGKRKGSVIEQDLNGCLEENGKVIQQGYMK